MAAHAKAKDKRRWLRWLGLVAIPLSLAVAGGAAWAYWIAGSTAGSNGASAATSVNGGATPTASAAGTAVTVSWAASTLANSTAVTGYLVKRYDANTLVVQTILTACAGTVTSTSCVESSVPLGSWKYSITPIFATNWQGAESAKSATVIVDNVAPVNAITLSSVTGGAYLTGTNVYYAGAALGSFKLTNALTDANSGPASSQTATLTGTTTGWTHTPSTVSTPTGGPYVSNVFSWGAGTSSGPGEAVIGSDVKGNTATTNLTFVNDGTPPSGASVSYVDGLTGGTTVTVTLAATDAGSGIASRVLQRATAPGATMAGACGTFGAFATVTGGTNPTSPFVDTVTIGNCYMYQYVVTDNVGNSTTATNTSVARAPYGATYAFTENGGTTTADGSGMDNTATLQAGSGWSTGRFGSALAVTGTNTSNAQVSRPLIDTSQSYTVAAWVKFTSVAGYQSLAGIKGTNVSPFYLQLASNGAFRFAQWGADANTPAIANIDGVHPVVGEWYHVAGVYNQLAGTIQLYVNGISQGSATAVTAWKAAGSTLMGSSWYNATLTDFVSGSIDSVGFYDRALTAAEVVTLRGPFSAYWALDAGSGTIAVDSTNTNTGALQAAAGWTTGKIGTNAVNLNGTATSYVDINTPVIDTNQSYTAAAWVKFNSVSGWQTLLSVDGAVVSPFDLQLDGSTGRLRFNQWGTDVAGGGTLAQVLGTTPTTGTWYHVAGVFDKLAGTITLYVNGVSQGSVLASGSWTAYGHTSIGRALWAGGNVDFLNGAVDEARLYDRALSANEIAALAGSYSTVISGTANLVSYWRLGESSGAASATDSKGTNTGTYTNGPTLGTVGAISNDTNTAVTFDGINDAVTASNATTGDFSIEFWFKSSQVFGTTCTQWWQGAGLVDAEKVGSANDYGISLCAGKVIFGVGNSAGDQNVVSAAATYNDGAWHYVVATRTQIGGGFQLYVDGVSQGTGTNSAGAALSASPTLSFGRLASGNSPFLGTLDEIAIYSSVLPGATISTHYAIAR